MRGSVNRALYDDANQCSVLSRWNYMCCVLSKEIEAVIEKVDMLNGRAG